MLGLDIATLAASVSQLQSGIPQPYVTESGDPYVTESATSTYSTEG